MQMLFYFSQIGRDIQLRFNFCLQTRKDLELKFLFCHRDWFQNEYSSNKNTLYLICSIVKSSILNYINIQLNSVFRQIYLVSRIFCVINQNFILILRFYGSKSEEFIMFKFIILYFDCCSRKQCCYNWRRNFKCNLLGAW